MNPRNISFKAKHANDAYEWLKTLQLPPYKKFVDNAIANTSVVLNDEAEAQQVPSDYVKFQTDIQVFCNDVSVCTRAALTRNSAEDRLCVLDFASYKHPGGGFLKGSVAQEEDLCHASGLYPCLASKQALYDSHEGHTYDSCYSSDYIYVKDCPFIIHTQVFLTDIIAIAAPNAKRTHVKPSRLEEILAKRMEVAFITPHLHGCTSVILGAFGCGVFGNDVAFVACEWKSLINKYPGLYKHVTFAIKDSQTAKIFKRLIC